MLSNNYAYENSKKILENRMVNIPNYLVVHFGILFGNDVFDVLKILDQISEDNYINFLIQKETEKDLKDNLGISLNKIQHSCINHEITFKELVQDMYELLKQLETFYEEFSDEIIIRYNVLCEARMYVKFDDDGEEDYKYLCKGESFIDIHNELVDKKEFKKIFKKLDEI